MVEATPPGGQPGYRSEFGTWSALGDWMKTWWQYLMAKVRRGEIAEIISQGWWGLYGVLKHMLLSPVLPAAALAVAILLALREKWKRKKQHGGNRQLMLLAEIFGHVENRARKMGVQRKPNETVADFAAAVAASGKPGAQWIRQILLRYQQLRFDPLARCDENVLKLKKECKKK